MADHHDVKSFFRFYESEETKQVFEQNEKEANRLSAMVILVCGFLLILSYILNMVGIFEVRANTMLLLAIEGLVGLSIPLLLYLIFRKKRCPWLKYVLVIGLLIVLMCLFTILNHNVVLVMAIPGLLSSRYCSKGFTMQISLLSIFGFALAALGTVYYGIADLNTYPQPSEGTVLVMKETLRSTILEQNAAVSDVIRRILLDSFLPRLLVLFLICMISVLIAKHGYQMVMDQNRVAKKAAAVSVELETATQIQNSMVPSIFPAFPDRTEFEIFASMDTAKEVGGDFFDFFLIDENHLALLIADVSGKGVPAALFMMATKILINDRTLMGGTPAEILEFVNDRICGNNRAEMFVTVWLGILDIRTGNVIASNAGHEYPVISRSGGAFELLKDKHGFVVGGMEGIKYKNYEFQLNKGDALFLYTDGVPEASNAAEELFTVGRMLKALNTSPQDTPEQLTKAVRTEIDRFVADAPQFDDITMLCIRYHGSQAADGKENAG